jgi:hypothetical protein
MNVIHQLTIVIKTQPAPTMVDLSFVLVRVDILEMELFAKVCTAGDDDFANHCSRNDITLAKMIA